MHTASWQYVGIWEGRLVAHTGIIHLPMHKGKKRVHRFVVLPDYQGIGIGTAFITAIGKIIEQEGFELNLTTTTPSLVPALTKSPYWILARYGRVKSSMANFQKKYGLESKRLTNSESKSRITYSFWYRGGVEDGQTEERDR